MADNAAIYVADPSLLGSKLFDSLPTIDSYHSLSENDSATGILFELEVGQVQVNFMATVDVPQHLKGFMIYAEQTFSGDEDDLIYLLNRINHVNFVMGCVISPGFDPDGMVEEFLFELTSRLNGLLFMHNTIFDYDQVPLAGSLAADTYH